MEECQMFLTGVGQNVQLQISFRKIINRATRYHTEVMHRQHKLMRWFVLKEGKSVVCSFQENVDLHWESMASEVFLEWPEYSENHDTHSSIGFGTLCSYLWFRDEHNKFQPLHIHAHTYTAFNSSHEVKAVNNQHLFQRVTWSLKAGGLASLAHVQLKLE